MFLHIGADKIVPLKNIIVISTLKDKNAIINKEFLKTMQEEEMLVDIGQNNAKSFIVTEEKVYLSAISALTLKKRADITEIEFED